MEVCGSTRTRGYGSGQVSYFTGGVESSRVRVDPLLTRRYVAILEATADHNIQTKRRF
jgi:hypothetical protein